MTQTSIFTLSWLRGLFISACGMSACMAATPEPYSYANQAARLEQAIAQQPNIAHAKNIILFIGDGMGVSTITASRILEGQQRGETGEENYLSWESFPNTAMIKVYNSNQQTPDSAGTMSAIMTGHKTKAGTFGYDEKVVRSTYDSGEDFGGSARKLETLLERFEKEGRSTGIVSTARITHATPAACYSHSPERNWEQDADVRTDHKDAIDAGFKDIALQLIEFPFGDGLEVALGGGRLGFIPNTQPDYENPSSKGKRQDGRNLINEWLKKSGSSFVYDKKGFESVDTTQSKKLLGLFQGSHMQYEVDRSKPIYPEEPSLTEMGLKALDILKQNEKGFFLMIESGRIDHAHHASNAYRALNETVELSTAVKAVKESLTEEELKETLIIVTADHSHTFTIAGYPTRGNPILGLVVNNDAKGKPEKNPAKDALGMPYTTLGYVNGGGYTGPMVNTDTHKVSPGGQHFHEEKGGPLSYFGDTWKYINVPREARPDLTEVDVECEHYIQEAAIPLGSETHGGEDVVVYATGPMAHLFRGVQEQNYIYHVMRYASDATHFNK